MRVFITGGAHGIGKATAEKLVERGHKVIVYDINKKNLEELPDQIQTYQGDVYDQERLGEVVKKEIFEVLVNCAGYQKQGAVEDVDLEEFETHFKVNLFGTVKAVKTALPMIRERDGRIINVSSIAGKLTVPFLGAYSSSKHAVEGFTDTLRMELKSSDVEVVKVQPGPIKTGFNEEGRKALEKYLPESRYSEKYREKLEKPVEGAKPEKAAKTIVKAVETSRPRTAYRVPWSTSIISKLETVVPTKIFDYLAIRQ